MNPEKELLRGLWVGSRRLTAFGIGVVGTGAA